MVSIVTIIGSPSPASRTLHLARYAESRLASPEVSVKELSLRDLPAEDLLYARLESPAMQAALSLVERAQGVVIATPVYKAAYSGLLKTFLDALPQLGLTGKVVLPLATGGSMAHVMALDYALRPVLASLNALHVVNGLFLLDKLVVRHDDGSVEFDADMRARLDAQIAEFADSVRAHGAVRRTLPA